MFRLNADIEVFKHQSSENIVLPTRESFQIQGSVILVFINVLN